jgi:tetratricopeptide (TPR) repeat protein
MARKKEIEATLSPQEHQQVLSLLASYHQIATALHTSTNQEEAMAALSPLRNQPETVQLAMIRELAKERDTDAADVLSAVNALSQQKEVRKEARRALIRLEASKTYPQWAPPITQTPAVQVNISNAPRFWKGFVTQTREEGELQLLLSWEQGYDYAESRTLIFLLDFWRDGVKDVIVDTGGKRRVDEHIDDMRKKLDHAIVVECTLAEGKRLIEDALSVNTWRGNAPAQEYRAHLPTINQLIFKAPEPGEDSGRTFINPELEAQEVMINFLGAWSLGDYGLAYDLLTEGNSVREGLSRDEWMERRRAWYQEAHPARLELGFVHEREQPQSTLWLPSSIPSKRTSFQQETEIGWSLELTDTPLSGTLPELPLGTAVNKESGRHWFWTSYTAVREQEVWRIQKMADEGAAIQGLPVAELQKRIKSYEEAVENKVKQRGINMDEVIQELSWRLTQLLHYYDALIVQLPLDRSIYENAYTRAIATGNPERTMVYLERMVNRFGENKGNTLRRLGATLATLAYNYNAPELKSRQNRFLERAEATLREAITIDDNPIGHILLAEFLLSVERNDESEQELLRAKMLDPTPQEEASIEAGLGNIAMRRELPQDAIPHFERVAALNQNYTGVWFSLGFAQRLLNRLTEAEESYKRAILVEPTDPRPYAELTAIYINQNQPGRARAILAQGIQANPNSAQLHALLASVLFETGDTRGAQREIEAAESLDPQAELVRNVKSYMEKGRKK